MKLIQMESIHLDNTINIEKFSKRIRISPRYVSLVVNEKLNKTFRDLINEERIKTVISEFSKEAE